MSRPILQSLVLSFILASLPAAAAPAIVISQVYGGGGNSGAPYRNDYVELFNRDAVPVSLRGWSVQYASAASSAWQVAPLPDLTLQPSDEDSGVDIFGRTAAQRVRQLWTVVGALLLTVALVPIAGFPLSFGALVFFVSTVVERRPLLVASLVTALSLLAVHLVFVMFLGVPLPTGLLGVGSF